MSDKEQGAISRRKFVSALGVAGLAMAAGSLHPEIAHASIGTSTETIPDVATLRASAGEYDGQAVVLASYYDDWPTTGNGPQGGGCFIWDSSATDADNGGAVFAVTGASGRWVRQNAGYVTPEMFGARSGGNDDTDAFLRMFSAGMPVQLGPYAYNIYPVPPSGESIVQNRGSLFKPMASVRGYPGKSKLVWGGETRYYHMALRNVTGISIEGIHFLNGAGGICIDPASDYSVSDISIVNCKFEGTTDLAISCGRQIALDVNAKKSSRVKISGNTFLNCKGHAIVLTSARDLDVIGNQFDGIWAGEGVNLGGYCVDISQGVRGCVVTDNVARNSTYFAKTESFVVSGATAENSLTTDVVIANNECIDMRPVYQSGSYVSGFAILINSRAGDVVIEGNRLTYNKGNGIYIYGSSAGDGSVVVKDNILLQTDAGNYASSGIYCEPNSSKRTLVQGNAVHGFYHGIVCHVGMTSVHDNDVAALQNAVVVSGVSEVSLEGNDLRGISGVVFGSTTSQFYKRVRINGNRIVTSTGICLDMTNAQRPIGCIVQGNVFERTDTAANMPALSANDIESWIISGNTFSVSTSSMRGLGLFGTVKTSVIRGNLTNGVHQIVATDTATVQQDNLTGVALI